MVKVHIHGPEIPKELKEFISNPEPKDLGSLISEMAVREEFYRKLLLRGGILRTDLTIIINGRNCMFSGGLSSMVKVDDDVDILLPMIGG